MMKRLLISLLLLGLGAFIAVSGHGHWSADPVRGYLPVSGVVLDHEVRLNRQRWNDKVRDAMEVATRVEFFDETTRTRKNAVVHDFFARGEAAWEFAAAEPAGGTVACLVAPDLQHGVRDGHTPSGPMMAMIVGGVIMLAGIALYLPFHPLRSNSSAVAVALLLVFFIAGVVVASQMWPEVIRHVRAARWDLVPCQVVGHRTVGSGKHTSRELLLRYTMAGRSYESVLNRASFGLGGGDEKDQQQCRVNPSKPWQVTLSWGWRPGLGVALFPVPFLAVGLLGLFIPFSALLQRQIKSRRTWKRLSLEPWQEVFYQGFALLFVGSIVGVFVSVCGELWLQERGERWFLTLFLIPFVCWVLKLAWSFAASLRKALRS